MENNSLSFDVSRGVDVMRGNKVIQHFDGADAYDKARAAAADKHLRGGYIRFWAAKESK